MRDSLLADKSVSQPMPLRAAEIGVESGGVES
jgi:hypothetical protein